MEMKRFHTAGSTAALRAAAATLWTYGWEYDASARILLLPVPSFDKDGMIRGGGRPEDLLTPDTVIFGGKLQGRFPSHRCFDLLEDPRYVAENAAITAHCTLPYILQALPVTVAEASVLILGWGRIGKCLSQLLQRLGAQVTVYARKETDRAMLAALGYGVLEDLTEDVGQFRVVVNTVPVMLLPKERLRPGQIKIDLASVDGIAGEDVIRVRMLPGKDAPERSGKLIAATVDRLGRELWV